MQGLGQTAHNCLDGACALPRRFLVFVAEKLCFPFCACRCGSKHQSFLLGFVAFIGRGLWYTLGRPPHTMQ